MKFKVKDYNTGEIWYEDENGNRLELSKKEILEEERKADDKKDECGKFSLQALRKIAREVGVKSPTSLTKEELVDAIMLVSTGEIIQPDSRRGRPPKDDDVKAYNYFKYELGSNLPEIEEFLDRPLNLYNPEDMANSYILRCPPMTYNEELREKSEIVTGYLEVMPQGHGRIRLNGYKLSDEDICLSEFLVKKHKLKSGQLVKGKCRKFHERKPKVMYELIGVEGQAENYEDIVFYEDLEYLPLTKNINFSNKILEFEVLKDITVENIKFGGKYFVENSSKKDLMEKANCFVKTLANHNKVRVIYLQVSARPEERAIECNNVECIRLSYGDIAYQSKSIITLLWEKAKRYMECGENVIVVMANYIDILKIFNRAITGHINVPITNDAWELFKQSVELAKNAVNGGSLTVFGFDNLHLTHDLNDFVSTELLPYFNNIFLV